MDNLQILQYLVYFIFLFALIAYATLDGFDLGVGCLHIFSRTDQERRLMINAIGPVWDGNTTWLVIGGGVLFAGFPKAYTTLTAGLYLPVMFLLFALMLRGVAIEFRSKKTSPVWRRFWDCAFFFASLGMAFDSGLVLGNLVQGLPLNPQGVIQAPLSILFRPYSLLVAFFGISLFCMHGSIYLLMKTEGELHERLRRFAKRLIVLFLFFWALTTGATFIYLPYMVAPFLEYPPLSLFAFFSLLSISLIPYLISRQKDGWAFVSSCFSIVFLLILFMIGTFPNIVYSTLNPQENSLTLFNSSVSAKALLFLVLIALTGIPLSFFYGAYIYRVFRGKVKLDSMSY